MIQSHLISVQVTGQFSISRRPSTYNVEAGLNVFIACFSPFIRLGFSDFPSLADLLGVRLAGHIILSEIWSILHIYLSMWCTTVLWLCPKLLYHNKMNSRLFFRYSLYLPKVTSNVKSSHLMFKDLRAFG